MRIISYSALKLMHNASISYNSFYIKLLCSTKNRVTIALMLEKSSTLTLFFIKNAKFKELPPKLPTFKQLLNNLCGAINGQK